MDQIIYYLFRGPLENTWKNWHAERGLLINQVKPNIKSKLENFKYLTLKTSFRKRSYYNLCISLEENSRVNVTDENHIFLLLINI